MSSDINQLLNPQLLADFREEMPPVQCVLWKGGTQYESIVFEEDLYPFDTLEQVKRLLCHRMRGDPKYLPKYLFVGIPSGEEEKDPSLRTTYYPLDYLWYPIGSNRIQDSYLLRHPIQTLTEPDVRFVAPDGSYASPNYESRSRTTLEQAFLKPRNGHLPTLHVFPFHLLYEAYRGVKPMSEAEWNKKFAPYFPDLSSEGPFVPRAREIEAAQQIKAYVDQREQTVNQVNRILQTAPSLPMPQLSGILQMILLWKKPVRGFQGCAALFYPLRATASRPYLRLLPAEGTGITKLHVDGILPIPTLHDPRIIEQWNKEVSPTPKMDFCCIKYVHRPAIMSVPPLYGTLHVMNDGTMKLAIQPPKTVSKLLPDLDFRQIDTVLEEVFDGLPQPVHAFQVHDFSAILTLKTSLSQPRFTKKRLQKRLATLQPFFREIKPLPDQSPILSLRYKAVSQYALENEVFAFITLQSTKFALEEGGAPDARWVEAIQNEFQFTSKEATDILARWFKMKGQFVVEVPEEGEISEGYHPGVDLHIYAQHPTYTVHLHRMDGEDTYRRLFTLLSVLFVDEDRYFDQVKPDLAAEMEAQEEAWDQERRAQEEKKEEEVGDFPAGQVDPIQASLEEEWGVLDDPLAAMAAPTPSAAPAVVAVAAAPVAPPQAAAPIRRPRPVKDGDRQVQPNQWFIRKLQELDKRLFGYTAGKGSNGYTSKCQAVDDRQPVILTKDQYDDMRKRYENDNDLFWIVYPLEGTEDPSPPAGSEKVTIMRYGSDATSIHYLFCPRFYCLYDEVMVRERDFLSEQDREGNPKPRNTCPFCYGGLLTQADRTAERVEGRTVVERRKKAAFHIGFLKDTTQPDGLSLPCCFIKQSTLRMEDPRFDHIRSQIQDMDLVPQEEPEQDGEEAVEYYETKLIEYGTLFQRVHGKYILESNKIPAPGLFATPSRRFDDYFHQDASRQLVTRSGIHLHVRPNANGFLRVGVDNTVNESLLGLIAPLLNATSIIEVKERLEMVIQPSIFLNAHFGNLVLEFFDPTNLAFMPETSHVLKKWGESLGIIMTSANSYALLRAFNAYQRFVFFLKDPRQRKELRHLQPFLAEPGLFTTNGLQLIVLEAKEDKEEEPIQIRCPLFGVSAERHKNNDVAFVSRVMRRVGATDKEYPHYELYLHTTNKVGRGGQRAEHRVIKAWKQAEYETWPEIVQQRVKEFYTQCQSNYRALYTPQRDIAQDSLLPLSTIIQGSPVRPDGIVKDYYNHLVGVTFRSKPGSGAMVLVPVVDDGVISVSLTIKKIYLDWEDVRFATAEDTIRYYQNRLATAFSLYKGYAVRFLVKDRRTQQIVALQLENRLYVPVAPTAGSATLDEFKLPVVVVEELESELNQQMSGTSQRGFPEDADTDAWEQWIQSAEPDKGCGKDVSMEHRLTVRELEELYQQFRIMVSQWLTGQRAGAGLRKQIEDVLFRADLPDYEKRKRLDILLSSTFLSWFYPDDNWEMPTLSLLRKDCRVIPTEEGCTGSCRWRETPQGGQCLLHIPETTSLSDKGDRRVATTTLFTRRILDELARFPSRRKQLMTKGAISVVTRLTQPIHEDDQYILPESSATWLDLLRFDWLRTPSEEPRFYEEMSREFTEEDQKGVEEMPAEWVARFGEETPLVIQWSDQPDTPLVPLMPLMGMSLADWGLPSDTKYLTKEHLKELARKTTRSVGLIEWSEEKYDEPFEVTFIKRKTEQDHVTLFIIISGRVGLLMEGEQTYLSVDLLPEELQKTWKSTPVTLFITKPQLLAPIPVPAHTTAAPATQQLLVQAKETEPPLVKKTFYVKRPILAAPIPIPSEPQPSEPQPSEPAVQPAKKTFYVKRPILAAPVPIPSEPQPSEPPAQPIKKIFRVKRPILAAPIPVPQPPPSEAH